VPVGKISPRLVHEWRAALLSNGVSMSVTAKAYRLLRAIMNTAVNDDNILNSNPCRIKGGGNEDAEERPVLTVRQVYDLAERVGRRLVGNIRKTPDGYRLRFRRDGVMLTGPQRYATRKAAERALWKMADDGRADCTHDRRFRALVLLTTFASLRWGEATALTRSDLDLKARTVRIRQAYAERSNGQLLLGPPKSRAGRRIVGIPAAIIPDLAEHLAVFVKDDPAALVFPGQKGGPLRRGNFNKLSAWPHAVESIGLPGLHFHDLRHTGNQFAAESKAGLKDLMARMGPRLRAGRDDLPAQGTRRGQEHHRCNRQPRRAGEAPRRRRNGRNDRAAGLMARPPQSGRRRRNPMFGTRFRPGVSHVERVTGIEPALSAWEADVLPLNYTRTAA
jgi:integrase